jgi:hypothetical protein
MPSENPSRGDREHARARGAAARAREGTALDPLDVGRSTGHGKRLWPRRLRTVARAVDIPVIAAGSMGCAYLAQPAGVLGGRCRVAFADILPYGRGYIAARVGGRIRRARRVTKGMEAIRLGAADLPQGRNWAGHRQEVKCGVSVSPVMSSGDPMPSVAGLAKALLEPPPHHSGSVRRNRADRQLAPTLPHHAMHALRQRGNAAVTDLAAENEDGTLVIPYIRPAADVSRLSAYGPVRAQSAAMRRKQDGAGGARRKAGSPAR